jgi:hypothetical protein
MMAVRIKTLLDSRKSMNPDDKESRSTNFITLAPRTFFTGLPERFIKSLLASVARGEPFRQPLRVEKVTPEKTCDVPIRERGDWQTNRESKKALGPSRNWQHPPLRAGQAGGQPHIIVKCFWKERKSRPEAGNPEGPNMNNQGHQIFNVTQLKNHVPWWDRYR